MKRSELRTMGVGDFSMRLGISIDRVRKGAARCSLRVERRHHNPNGVLHGGITAILADTAMGIGLMSALGPGGRCTTVDLQMSYAEPVRSGRVTAEGYVVHRGRRLAHTRCEVKNGKGRVVALASGSFYVFSGANEAGGGKNNG